ncbi:MAG: hypothetical protein AAF063_29900, partial [Cyanobacteria bacterium J06643_5]
KSNFPRQRTQREEGLEDCSIFNQINFDDLIRLFVGWVERSETQHPSWVALRLTQPTIINVVPIKINVAE